MIRTYLKALIAALIIGATAVGAFALNVDQTRVMNRRYLGIQAVHYYRLTVNYNDPHISTAQMFGGIGQYAYIARVMCYVGTTFNAVSSNAISIGITTASNEILAATGGATAACNLASATHQDLTAAAGLGTNVTSAGDVTLYVKYAQTGTAATQGQATFVIEWIPNNDM